MLEPTLSILDFAILLVSSFLGSLLSAAAGVGGGSFLLIVMASLLPPAALIPVHGLVQLGSNSVRLAKTRAHIQADIVFTFAAGSIVAALLGLFFLIDFNTDWIPAIVSLFILWLCWGTLPKLNLGSSKLGMLIGGCLTTYLSLFVGASGPLVSAWIGLQNQNRWQYTANFSSCMTLQHLLKILVFGVLGFTFSHWLALILAMIFTGYFGTKIGLLLLEKLPQEKFMLAFKILLTTLALRLLWSNLAPQLLSS